jgi:Flp pilus assembly protein TadD
MGVLIECENVLIRNATVEQRLPGGMQEYERRCPNGTFCTDGLICRVGFMVPADAAAYIDHLASCGFARPTLDGSPEVALINQVTGFVLPCDWLELNRIDLGGNALTAVAWLKGTVLSQLVAPPHWKPGMMVRIATKDLGEGDFLGTREGVDVFRNKSTGERLYVGRTQEGAPPSHISAAMVQERFLSLADELTRLGALEDAPSGDYQGDVASCYQRAKQLLEDTQAAEPGPLQLQGIAARLLKRWDEAVSLFRRVTELRPEYLAGWLELTWALASLRRFEDAERAARTAVALDPENASALGNLAAVLLERDKIDEARLVAQKALVADPEDAKNQAVLAAIERASPQAKSWWRRLSSG